MLADLKLMQYASDILKRSVVSDVKSDVKIDVYSQNTLRISVIIMYLHIYFVSTSRVDIDCARSFYHLCVIRDSPVRRKRAGKCVC